METKIEITKKQDIEEYKLFCKHRENILFLIEQGVFDIRGATITLHLDKDAIVQEVVMPMRRKVRSG